jgi:hypothetical protein
MSPLSKNELPALDLQGLQIDFNVKPTHIKR